MTLIPSPLISVVIPSYNYGSFLPRCLDAIASQPGNDFEVIVVDDGSTDQTAEVVEFYRRQSGCIIRYAFQENRGPGAARNHGVRLAAGRYVLFQDADDVLLPKALYCFRSAIHENVESDFFWGGVLQVHYDGRVERSPIPQLASDREQNFLRYLRLGPGLTYQGTILVRRAVFRKISWPEASYSWADVVYHSHLFALCDGVAFHEPVIIINKHPVSLGDNLEVAKRDRLKTVDLLFDPRILPESLMVYRQEFLASVFVSLIKSCFNQGLYEDAMRLSHRAFLECPSHLLMGKHFRRYRRIVVKLFSQRVRRALNLERRF